jgi:hypothetical protein
MQIYKSKYNCKYYCKKYIIDVEFRDQLPYKINEVKYKDLNIKVCSYDYLRDAYKELDEMLYSRAMFEVYEKIKPILKKIKYLMKSDYVLK